MTPKQVQQLKQFTRFLKNHHSYASYKANAANPTLCLTSLHTLIRHNLPASFINDAFYYQLTPQGSKYWSNLSREWNALINTTKPII